MADYPIPVFHFRVEWGGKRIGFTEVTGLTKEVQAIEYREGSSPEPHATKMPGMEKFSNITLKRGIISKDGEFFEWINNVYVDQNNDAAKKRRDLSIHLVNELDKPVVTWKVKKAFPVKMEGPGLKATGNEAAIESLEIAHEGWTIEYAS